MPEVMDSVASMAAGITESTTATAGNISSIATTNTANPASNFNAPKLTPDSTQKNNDGKEEELKKKLKHQLKKATTTLQINIDNPPGSEQSLLGNIDNIKDQLKESITKLDELKNGPLGNNPTTNNTKDAKNSIGNTITNFPQMNPPI